METKTHFGGGYVKLKGTFLLVLAASAFSTVSASGQIIFTESFVGSGDQIPITDVGWDAHYGSSATPFFPLTGSQAFHSAPYLRGPDIAYVLDNTPGTGARGDTTSGTAEKLIWTAEIADANADISALTDISFSTERQASVRVALQLDNSTSWYLSQSYAPGNHSLNVASETWSSFTFDPGADLIVGSATSLPTNGTVTGLGFYYQISDDGSAGDTGDFHLNSVAVYHDDIPSGQIIFMETFVGSGDQIPITDAGWDAHYGSSSTPFFPLTGSQAFHSAPYLRGPDIAYVLDNTPGTGARSDTTSGTAEKLIWTTEIADANADVSALTDISFSTEREASVRVALQLDNSTSWYLSQSYAPGNHSLNVASETWSSFTFDPGAGLIVGSATSLPTNGTVTGLGFYYQISDDGSAGDTGDFHLNSVAVYHDGILNEDQAIITSLFVDGSGQFIIDFEGTPSANYEVKKSNELADFNSLTTPLIITTQPDGSGQAVIPATEMASAKQFFVLENYGAEASTYRLFNVIEVNGRVLRTEPIPSATTPLWAEAVQQETYTWPEAEQDEPYFEGPIPFVRPPVEGSGEPFGSHHHCPAITWCDNGDLLAIWYTTPEDAREGGEKSTDLTMLAARLRAGASEWDPSSEFFKAPQRNMHGDGLIRLSSGRLLHFNGMGKEGVEGWDQLAMLLRESDDNGVTWTAARPVSTGASYAFRHMPIAGGIETSKGWLIQPCDAVPGAEGPSALHISRDGGATWQDAGGNIKGIHAGVVELSGDRLLAFGRAQAIDGFMPQSLSDDFGASWTYSATPFPPVKGGQRLVLLRLNEGPLLLVSFANGEPEMIFEDSSGSSFEGRGLFAALSFDEGQTWPVRKLITPGSGSYDGKGWTGIFEATPEQAEPLGYLAATQTPDGIIHLISSGLHYRFNQKWLETPNSR